MKNKHLKGFTILEALISLMLMSIIITLTYSLFNLIGKQLSLFKEENTQVLEYNLFNTTLLNDIEKSHDFRIVDEQLILKNYDNTEINYLVKESTILRGSQINTGTFKVRVLNYEFLEKDTNHEDSNMVFKMSLLVLNDTIGANYFLKKDRSEIINSKYFNEY